MSGSVFVIAEAGVNHNGRRDLALALVDAAVEAGADAVKFQTFSAERLASRAAGMAAYQERNLGRAEPQVEMLRRLELAEADHFALAEHCHARGIVFLSSPFDMESLAFLIDAMALPRIKVPSGELTNGPYLLALGRSGRHAIVSTGMAVDDEIALALDVLAWGYLGRPDPIAATQMAGTAATPDGQAALADKVTLLHCTSEYPAPYPTINLKAMPVLGARFGLPVGLSDHSEGIAVAIAATAMGATVVEKHLTLDRGMDGPDHRASVEPAELSAMIDGIRAVEQALGSGEKTPSDIELATRQVVRKSLVAQRAIAAGQVIAAADIAAKRPGGGLSPMRYWETVGRTAPRAYQPGDMID